MNFLRRTQKLIDKVEQQKNTKNWLIYIRKISLIIFLLFTITPLIHGCSFGYSTGGIPHAIYSRINEEGTIINEGPEGAWIISKDKAEYRYLVYTIVNIENKTYFEIERVKEGSITEEESGLFLYRFEYDKKSKILTVNMPSTNGQPYHIPTTNLVMIDFEFKKSGNVIF